MKKHGKKRVAPSTSRGFTLIEVVLVLAIGGLIFLLAFLAFQQVSRNRRDTQRRSDAGRIVAELQNYAGDNNGAYPANSASGEGCTTTGSGTFGAFLNGYLCQGGFDSPQRPYSVVTSTESAMGTGAAVDSIMYTNNYSCLGSADSIIRVQIRTESGIICRDSK